MPTITFPQSAETVVAWDRTGLTGTIGVSVIDNIGGTTRSRSTIGVSEFPAGSGVYQTAIAGLSVAGFYSIVWDDFSRYDVVPLTVIGVPSGFTGGFFDQPTPNPSDYDSRAA